MTHAEIGTVLGLSRGAVWTIYHRALRKLRKSHPGILGLLREAAYELDSHRIGDDGDA
jgi:DNA-directed RNA polymerase sigma subunit (sigma70/sigma32)